MHDIFFFTDIHGVYNLYRAIMDFCNEQDPEAMIIFGGDACDRGKEGYRIMKELLDNPYVVYLKGNHEDMFAKAAREIIEQFDFTGREKKDIKKVLNFTKYFDYKYQNIQASICNGGINTLLDWIEDGKPLDIVEKLEHLPLTFSTDVCDFCHAAGVYSTFKRVADTEYENKKVDSMDEEIILWTRSAFEYGWEPNRIAIHGHTPVQHLLYNLEIPWPEDKDVTPYKYTGNANPYYTGAKIDMDVGTAFTGRAFVLNILTMQAQGFEANEYNQVEKIECIKM